MQYIPAFLILKLKINVTFSPIQQLSHQIPILMSHC